MITDNKHIQKFLSSFKKRVAATKRTRWIRFGIVAAIFLAWVIWMQNLWLALLLILLFDIYITGFIPLTWWKKSKSKIVRGIMSWVDAIVYALVLVYFVFTFVGQNYQIPTSSLEKTLLVGDYLWVNKMAYGPRVPMTPIHFPLVQNTLPLINTKSYLDKPQLPYRRLKGYTSVKTGDIVVFNFPAGDTVLPKLQNPEAQSIFAGIDYYTLVNALGYDVIKSHEKEFGKPTYRPVDRRDNYVKRAVGLPGERLAIRNGVIYINGKPQAQPDKVQFKYWFQTRYPIPDYSWQIFRIAPDDRHTATPEPEDYQALKDAGFDLSENMPPIYEVPLTANMIDKIKNYSSTIAIMKAPVKNDEVLFPAGIADRWTRDNYGEIWIPKKGETIKLDSHNWAIYNRAIRNYEMHHNSWLAEDGTVYIDGQPAEEYTFAMDYYFMMGDNRDNSLDSRYWGFVPEDHIVGKPMRVVISFNKNKNLFNGGIRWSRIFKDANPGL